MEGLTKIITKYDIGGKGMSQRVISLSQKIIVPKVALEGL